MNKPFIYMCVKEREMDAVKEWVNECLLQVLQAAFRHMMAEIYVCKSGTALMGKMGENNR